MTQAINIFNSLPEKEKGNKEDLILIKVRYFIAMANILYIQGKYDECKPIADEALQTCSDETKLTYSILNEIQKLKSELLSLVQKCNA
jgi:hypothetical protein